MAEPSFMTDMENKHKKKLHVVTRAQYCPRSLLSHCADPSTKTVLLNVVNDLLLVSDYGCVYLLILLVLSIDYADAGETKDQNIHLHRLEYIV